MNKDEVLNWAHRCSLANLASGVFLGLGIAGWHWVFFVLAIFTMFVSFHFDNMFQEVLFGKDDDDDDFPH